MRGVSIFWSVYILFFIIGLPLIIHYNVQFVSAQKDPIFYMHRPLYSVTSLALGTIFWIVCIVIYYSKFIASTFYLKRKILRLSRHGHKVVGTVLSNKVLFEKNGHQALELSLGFKNFSDTEVKFVLELVDSKPFDHRFRKGNNISLLLDRDIKPPYVHVENAWPVVSRKRMFMHFAVFFGLIGFWLTTLLLSYHLESQGFGWRYLSLWHPYVIMPASALFYYFLFSAVQSRMGTLATKTNMNLLLNGRKVFAEITKLEQTGVYLNEQPELRFELTFFDYQHKRHIVTIKKVTSLLHIYQFTVGQQLEILYLPDEPSRIMFYG